MVRGFTGAPRQLRLAGGFSASYPGFMCQPGDYEPAPDVGPRAVRLVGPERCGQCGSRPGPRVEGWRYRFDQCMCTDGARGHHVWAHDCGWSLAVPPHDPDYRTPPSYR